jgi:hypothetical protein
MTDLELMEKYAVDNFFRINEMSETKEGGKFKIILDEGICIVLSVSRWQGTIRIKAEHYENIEIFLNDDKPFLSYLSKKIEEE